MKLPALLVLPVLALAPAAANATDITGLWMVSTSLGGAPVVMDCSLLQVGVALSGWCEPESAAAAPIALTGQLDRTNATWGYDLNLQGRPVHVTYRGVLSSDSLSMSGQFNYGGAGAGLTAMRK